MLKKIKTKFFKIFSLFMAVGLVDSIIENKILAAVIMIAFICLVYFIYRAWEKYNETQIRLSEERTEQSKEKTKRSKEETKRSKEETKRHYISIKSPLIERSYYGILMEMESFINQMKKQLDDEYDDVTSEGSLVNIAKGEHSNVESVQDKVCGNYRILKVDSGNVENGFRIIVRNVDSGDEIKVAIPTNRLSDSQLAYLQNSEWSKSEFYMQINIERIKDRIHSATLIRVGLPDDT